MEDICTHYKLADTNEVLWSLKNRTLQPHMRTAGPRDSNAFMHFMCASLTHLDGVVQPPTVDLIPRVRERNTRQWVFVLERHDAASCSLIPDLKRVGVIHKGIEAIISQKVGEDLVVQ